MVFYLLHGINKTEKKSITNSVIIN